MSSLSPIKQSKDSEGPSTQSFGLDIQTDPQAKVCGACFAKECYPVFKELNDSATGCTMKYSRQPQEDILINDMPFIIKTSLDVEQSSDIKYSEIKTIMNEYRL